MNDSRELTLQERSTKRANYCLMLTVLIISIYMMFLFIGTILQGNHALFRLFVIAGMIALPAAVSTLFYFFYQTKAFWKVFKLKYAKKLF